MHHPMDKTPATKVETILMLGWFISVEALVLWGLL